MLMDCEDDALLTLLPRPVRSVSAFAVVAITVIVVGQCAFYTIFTAFRPYDDEGAMLLVLRGLARGHVLYDQVAAMYGPIGFFPKLAVVKILDLPINHNVSRTISWLIYSTGCFTAGAAVWRATRQISAFVLMSFATYFLLRWFGGESGHPQDQCQFLISLAALVAVFAHGKHIRMCCIALAAIGSLLAMTKGNLGVFFLAAFAVAMVLSMRRSHLRFGLLIIGSFAIAILPYALMRASLDAPQVFRFFISFECAILGCLLIANGRTKEEQFGIRDVVFYISCFIGGVLCIGLATMADGTTLHGLAEGLIYLPLRGSGQFSFYWRQTSWMIPSSVIGLILACGMCFYLKARGEQRNDFLLLIAILKIAGGAIIAKTAICDAANGQELLMATMPSLLWLFLMPSSGRGANSQCIFSKTFLVFLAVMQTLGSYPNAGAQQAIGLIVPVIIGTICFYEGVQSLGDHLPRQYRVMIAAVINGGVLGLVLLYGLQHDAERSGNYKSFVSLDLPGSGMIHVSADQLARMKTVVNTIRENGDAFLTLPGMNSYYLWTGMAPPTDANVTNWMLLSQKQQRENFAALQTDRRPCVFFDIETAKFWNKAIPNAQQAPIVTLIDSHYRLGVAQSSWLLLVPNERTDATLVDAAGNKTRMALPPLPTSRQTGLPVDPQG